MTNTNWEAMLTNIRWGIAWGLSIAAIASLWILLLSVANGSASFDKLGVSAAQIILAYCVSGAVAGAIVGVFREQAGTEFGAMLVGFAAVVPFAIAVFTTTHGNPAGWSHREWRDVLIFCALLGPASGRIRWRQSPSNS